VRSRIKGKIQAARESVYREGPAMLGVDALRATAVREREARGGGEGEKTRRMMPTQFGGDFKKPS